jgi:hypothetical protein
MLDSMHYRGLIRVARRDGGTRVYAAREPFVGADHLSPQQRLDALLDLIVGKYSPLPVNSLSQLAYRLKFAAPQFNTLRRAAFERAKERLPHARVQGVEWYWAADENPASRRWRFDDEVRLLAPFDPVVWDRPRFEHFWGWAYRFEAYVPAPKRKLGYYALPLLWQDRIVGWGNAAVRDGKLRLALGYADGAPREPAFRRELADERARLGEFLGL